MTQGNGKIMCGKHEEAIASIKNRLDNWDVWFRYIMGGIIVSVVVGFLNIMFTLMGKAMAK